MADTKIEWTDKTWNPVRGCSRVSAGCMRCYAEGQAHRFSGPGQPYEGLTKMTSHGVAWTGVVRTVPEMLEAPLHWSKPARIFVNSMSDLFHEDVPDEFLPEVFAVMAASSRHTYQALTKRAERMREVLNDHIFFDAVECIARQQYRVRLSGDDWPLRNVWLGVSVEDQATADERIPLLLQTPAAVRWISAEPLLGPVDLTPFLYGKHERVDTICQNCPRDADCECGYHTRKDMGVASLSWVVTGGESGPKARPSHPDWFRSLRDQCAAAGVPFLFKQWGAWVPHVDRDKDDPDWRADYTLTERQPEQYRILNAAGGYGFSGERVHMMKRVGKKAAGRTLDGRIHDEYPV